MKIYYLRYVDPLDVDITETRFFKNLSEAQKEADLLNKKAEDFAESRNIQYKKEWEKQEAAFQSLLDSGLDAKSAMPYHKREYVGYKSPVAYLIDWIETEDE